MRGVCMSMAEIGVFGQLIMGLRHLKGGREANKHVNPAYFEIRGWNGANRGAKQAYAQS
jgi:hypothetical protein